VSAASMCGSPPRRRGGSPTAALNHPHVGRDRSQTQRGPSPGYGSPPRRRRPPKPPGVQVTGGRLTPASAGTTAGAVRADSAHPRVGGDHWSPTRIRSVKFGSPPRRRGPPGLRAVPRDLVRFTPASAGTTGRRGRATPARPVHPRVGGDHFEHAALGVKQCGSPLRRQGPRLADRVVRAPFRFAPASAGTTPHGQTSSS
jgi:hypothetical protein